MKPARARAFTLIELLVVVATLVIAVAFLLPALMRPRRYATGMYCSNHLKQIGLSFRTWALDNNGRFPMQVSVTNGGTMELVASGVVFRHFQVMSNELSTPTILICPMELAFARTMATTFGPEPAAPYKQVVFKSD